jgi:hypothetical protein
MSSNNYDGATPLPFQWWLANIGSWPTCDYCHQRAGAHHSDHGACPDGTGGYFTGKYYCIPQQVAASPKLSVPLPTHSTGIPANFKKAYDPNEECACGIGLMRSQCNYHRE